MAIYILGISAYYHDSAAALIKDGDIIAAAQEERFSRKKHDSRFPGNSISFCLSQAGITIKDLTYIVFYDKPLLKFERILETYLAFAPKGFKSFVTSMPIWLKDKLFLRTELKKELSKLAGISNKNIPQILFSQHHQSHAASAFYPSPFETAGILCLDGVGEWATTSVWLGEKNKIVPQWEIGFPHSLGLLYSAFTYYTGFKVNSGEYKLMGLAPYGEPKYVSLILDNIIDIKEDGTFRLNMEYFNYAVGLTMTSRKFDTLFGGPARKAESKITQREVDIAKSIQVVIEDVVLRLCYSVYRELGTDNLCLAGGVALNCVANGRILREGPFKDIWIQPASGDAGGALGASLTAWYLYCENQRYVNQNDSMKGSLLGPEFSNDEIFKFLNSVGAKFIRLDDHELFTRLAEKIDSGNVIGLFQGRMEFGPRALGNRSIIGDPRNPKMQSVMNLKIKYRESFRPFAPSVLIDRVSDYFEMCGQSPYMLLVAPVKKDLCLTMTEEKNSLFCIEKINVPRSQVPAITHVDYSARIQTVHRETNPRYYDLIKAFENRTGCGMIVNTSFNIRGEPIVCTLEDAYRCFMRTEMDYLVLQNYLLSKLEQPRVEKDDSWKREYELD